MSYFQFSMLHSKMMARKHEILFKKNWVNCQEMSAEPSFPLKTELICSW